MSEPRHLRPNLATTLAFAALFVLLPATGFAEVVDENTADWAFLEEVPGGVGVLSAGPGTPPVGQSSAHFVVDGTGRELFGTDRFNGTRFDQITSLSYATFRSSPEGGVLALSLQFNTDYDVTDENLDWQGRLVFEPYQDGSMVNDLEWQTWDALAGVWWSSGSPGNTVCMQASPCTWAEVLAAFPDAGIHTDLGAVLLKAGGPWPDGFFGAADDLRIGIDSVETQFDFETDNLFFADGFESGDTTAWSSTMP